MGFQTKLKAYFQKEGYKVLKLVRLSENGYPDLMLLKDGKTIFVEVKEESDTLKELQKLRINELISNGFKALCIQKTKGIIYGSSIEIKSKVWQ